MRVVVALLGLAGATLYGSYSYFSPGTNRSLELAELTQIMTGPARTLATAQPGEARREGSGDAQRAQRVFSPQQPLLPPQPTPAVRPAETPGGVVASRRSDPFDTVPAVRQSPVREVTAAALPAIEPTSIAALKPSAARPTTEEARAALVRDLQRELKRVGCYDGEATGSWGVVSKRAMSEFTSRVNASLPVETPDYVLLALVRGHAGQACGSNCPGGRGPDGRCASREMVAQPQPSRGAAGWSAEARRTAAETVAVDDTGLESRAAAMASQLASAPLPDRPRRVTVTETGAFPAAAGATSSIASTRTAVPPATRTGPVDPRSTSAAAALPPSTALPMAPLPGRMAVGAAPAAEPAVSPAVTGRVAGLPARPEEEAGNGYDGPAGWSTRMMPPDSDPAGRPAPKRNAAAGRAEPRPRYTSYQRPAYYYERPAPSSGSRPRSGGSLKHSGNVRDFFFGPGRGSF